MRSRAVSAVLVTLLCLGLPLIALGDFRPDPNPTGGNLAPEGATKVQMLREAIVLEVQSTGSSSLSPDVAAVTGDFAFKNQGQANEQMRVLFPVASEYSRFYVGRDLRVWVDGREVITKEVKKRDSNGTMYTWRGFTASFPPAREVHLTVKYLTDPLNFNFNVNSANPPTAFGNFAYTFATGAAWFGKIGAIDLTVRLPYTVTKENFAANMYRLFSEYQTSPVIPQYRGNEAHWRWENVEPTDLSVLEMTTPATWLWRDVLETRTKLARVPTDLSANQTLIRLMATLYGSQNRELGGVDLDKLLDICRQGFKRLPKSLELRFLCFNSLPAMFFKNEYGSEGDPVLDAMLDILGEINQIDPYNLQAEALYANLSQSTPYNWQTLPATPPRAGSLGASAQLSPAQTVASLAQSAQLRPSQTKGCAAMLLKLKPNPGYEARFQPERSYAYTAPTAPFNVTKASLERAIASFGRTWISPLWGTDEWFLDSQKEEWAMSVRFFANLDGSRRYAVAVRDGTVGRTVCFLTYLRQKP